MDEFDVLVAGGGGAGLAAAIAASRTGAKTVLVERSGTLGGMVSASLIHSLCGLYYLPEFREGEFANPGFASEFAQGLLKTGGARGPVRMGRVEVLLHSPSAFAQLADQWVMRAPSLQCRFHSELIAVDLQEGTVEVFCRGIRTKLRAKSVVDATGDGVVAALAGHEFERETAARLQRPAYIFSIQNVPPSAVVDQSRLRIARLLAGAVKEQRIAPGALGVAMRAGSKPGEVYVTIDLAAGNDFDPTESLCLTRLEMEGRFLAGQIATFLVQNAPGFEQGTLASLPARVGVRESRRVCCEYRLEAEDLARGSQFEDAVAVAAWPMELREQATGPKLRYPEGGRPCDVPLRSLRAVGKPNLFIAGRCIGASHEAQASIRVIGTCFATGESAGIAAALHAEGERVTAAAIKAVRIESLGIK